MVLFGANIFAITFSAFGYVVLLLRTLRQKHDEERLRQASFGDVKYEPVDPRDQPEVWKSRQSVKMSTHQRRGAHGNMFNPRLKLKNTLAKKARGWKSRKDGEYSVSPEANSPTVSPAVKRDSSKRKDSPLQQATRLLPKKAREETGHSPQKSPAGPRDTSPHAHREQQAKAGSSRQDPQWQPRKHKSKVKRRRSSPSRSDLEMSELKAKRSNASTVSSFPNKEPKHSK